MIDQAIRLTSFKPQCFWPVRQCHIPITYLLVSHSASADYNTPSFASSTFSTIIITYSDFAPSYATRI